MDTRCTRTPRRHRTLTDLHALLLSVAVGFCVLFGGGLILAEQTSIPTEADPMRAEVARDAATGSLQAEAPWSDSEWDVWEACSPPSGTALEADRFAGP